jgi:hypothetical protein
MATRNGCSQVSEQSNTAHTNHPNLLYHRSTACLADSVSIAAVKPRDRNNLVGECAQPWSRSLAHYPAGNGERAFQNDCGHQPAAAARACHCWVVVEEPVRSGDDLPARAGVAAWLENCNSETAPRSDQVGSYFSSLARWAEAPRHRVDRVSAAEHSRWEDQGEHTASFAARAENAGELYRPR